MLSFFNKRKRNTAKVPKGFPKHIVFPIDDTNQIEVKVKRLLSEGAYAYVYLAEDCKDKELKYAIKHITEQ